MHSHYKVFSESNTPFCLAWFSFYCISWGDIVSAAIVGAADPFFEQRMVHRREWIFYHSHHWEEGGEAQEKVGGVIETAACHSETHVERGEWVVVVVG